MNAVIETNVYKYETVEELERIMDMMIEDKIGLLANGWNDIAAQNDAIIAAIATELRRRA